MGRRKVFEGDSRMGDVGCGLGSGSEMYRWMFEMRV